MNNNIINKLIVFIVCSLAASPYVFAEGSFQTGLNQPLRDYDASNERLFVDILSSGEVINVHLCGDKDSDDVSIKIYDPSNNLVLDTSRTESTIACNDALNAPLSNAIKYTTLTTGAYALELNNNGSSGDTLNLRRFDVTVTPDLVTDPDPGVAGGRLWSNLWSFDTGSFSEVAGTDADYYPLVPGGRTNTHYVWKLDLNKFSGNVYEIIANDLGVDAPRSGYSTLVAGNTAAPKFPIYLTYPIVAKPRPTDPPVINSFRFIDDAGQDYAISPSVTSGVQDSGNFEFTSDINGTYSIIIDTNNDGAYDADDVQLLGNAVAGSNQVAWDGRDASGNTISTGTYSAKLSLRMGEYHFIGRDVETSGGPSADGLTIYLADSNASAVDTNVYWDDKTLLGGTSTLPTGAVSSSMAGKHTWGNFSSSSIGNVSFIDTYVYGLSSTATALVAISTSDVPLAGVDGTLAVSPLRSNPGDTLTATVADADLNLNPGVAESIIIRVLNNRSSEVEQISLTETGSNTGIFSGTASTAENATAGINNDGSINSIVNDVLTFTYQDQLDSVGGSTARMVLHSVGIADTGTSTISALPDSIIADGITTSAVTIQLKDASGNNLTTGGDTVILSTTAGTLGAVTDNNNGTYNATLTSSTTIEMATISGTLNGGGNVIVDTATVTFTASVASTATSTLMASPGSIVANGLSTTTVTVQLKDASGNNLTTGGDTVVLSTTAGTLGAVTDNNNGTYSSTLTSSAVIVTATISGTLNGGGNTIADTATVAFTAGAASTTTSTLTASPASITANGSSTSTITIQAKDASGNNLTSGGDAVVLSTTAGTLGTVTDNNNGTYTATLTSSTSVETATISGTLNGAGNTIANTASVAFVALDDADGDGIPDADEGTGDTDGDGIPDFQDPDSDNDGIPDTIEKNIDSDNDGVADYKDLDSDNDGVTDAVEGATDTDSDGIADYLDLDTDSDGIPDIKEAGGTDSDGNGLVDNLTDANSDGLDDAIAASPLPDTDSDNDGIPDRKELDSDNDGIYDLVEAGGTDNNSDGLVDGLTDNDNDGFDDTIVITPLPVNDTDLDGVPDYRDLDSDNDGLPDVSEGAVDTDLDGVPDYHDLDSDNDGIPDITEAGGVDIDGDARIDNPVDSNGDGIDDATAAIPLADSDSDVDNIPDRRELDSDNDGVNDLREAGGVDVNNDGIVDGFTDINGDGYDDMTAVSPLSPPDTDNDGLPDYQDNDDLDNDGVPDTVDLDDDNDGIPDAIEGMNDSDNDGIADSLELDSDNDGIRDLTEAGGIDSNNDGKVDNPVDNNADGLDDILAVTPLPDTDSDSDGLPDRREEDSDNDGIPDSTEGVNDTDGDGIPDYRDLDSDNDGIPDADEGLVDTDNDGVPDYRDLDSDNDGVQDILEAGDVDGDSDGKIDNLTDANGDGLDDGVTSAPLADKDTDSDGKPDRQDLDSDNDKVSDIVEAGGTDNNSDGVVDGFVDADGDGRDDSITATPLVPPDSNSNGVPDFQENEKGIETGLKGVGGGCSISTQPTVDPMLPLLLLISVMVMTARIKNRTRK